MYSIILNPRRLGDETLVTEVLNFLLRVIFSESKNHDVQIYSFFISIYWSFILCEFWLNFFYRDKFISTDCYFRSLEKIFPFKFISFESIRVN